MPQGPMRVRKPRPAPAPLARVAKGNASVDLTQPDALKELAQRVTQEVGERISREKTFHEGQQVTVQVFLDILGGNDEWDNRRETTVGLSEAISRSMEMGEMLREKAPKAGGKQFVTLWVTITESRD